MRLRRNLNFWKRQEIFIRSNHHKANIILVVVCGLLIVVTTYNVYMLSSDVAEMKLADSSQQVPFLNSSYTITPPSTSTSTVFHPSAFYPWIQHLGRDETKWNFQALWNIVHRPDPQFIQQQLYAVRNGKLYGWRRHQNNARLHEAYDHRVVSYEQLIASSLHLAHQIVHSHNQHMGLDPRIPELLTQPFPFVVDWADFLFCEFRHRGSPFFAYLTFPHEMPRESCILIGMPTYAQWLKYWHVTNNTYWDDIFQQQHLKYPWSNKINQAVWRGATTGEKVIYPDWRNLPRTKLVQYSLQHPDIINAGFTRYNNRNEKEKQEIISAGLSKNFIEMIDCQKYKAILDIDGNSWSSRFADLLCMNSVVIKVQPQWVDYFHPELQPWVHYIPVHQNLSNLAEVVNLVISNDTQEQMKTIVHNANQWCKSKITGNQMTIDMMWILISYVDILKREDSNHGGLVKTLTGGHHFEKWKHSISSGSGWDEQNWIEIPFNMTTKK
jgi:hypothetical protein